MSKAHRPDESMWMTDGESIFEFNPSRAAERMMMESNKMAKRAKKMKKKGKKKNTLALAQEWLVDDTEQPLQFMIFSKTGGGWTDMEM